MIRHTTENAGHLTHSKYELVAALELGNDVIEGLVEELHLHGECCKVFIAYEETGTVEGWRDKMIRDNNTECLLFLVDGNIAGMARITKKPKHVANGNIGYLIRPNCRGRQYASVLLHLLVDRCRQKGMARATACVEESNVRSIKALKKSGFRHNGTIYEWIGNRIALEFEVVL